MNVPALRFPEFGGAQAKRSELAVLAVPKGLQTGPFGSQLKAEEYVDDENGIPVVMPRDIRSGVIVADKVARIDYDKADEMKRHRLEFGDVVFPRRGELGRIAVVGHDQVGWICGTGCLRFRPNLDLVDPSYLGISFSREHVVYWLESNAVGQTMLNLNTEILGGMPVLAPSLPEQKKIAAFLGVVDAKIAAVRARRAGLERYKRGLMQALFSQTLRFTKPDGTAFPDWEEKKFSDFLIPNFRAEAKPLNNYLAIGIRSHGKGTFQKPDSDPERTAMDTLYVVRENDLVVNITFAWEGAIAIVPKRDDGGYVSHRFPTYEFIRKVVAPEYFEIVISDPRFRRKLGLISPGGAGRNRVMSKPDFLKLRQMFPSCAEQAKIAETLSAMDAEIAAVGDQAAKMEAFKKGLLQQMFV